MKINLNQKFYETFSEKELIYLLKISNAYGKDIICISLKKSFIEICTDIIPGKIDISFDDFDNKVSKKLSRDELLNMCYKDIPFDAIK